MNSWLTTYLYFVSELNRLLNMRFVWDGHDYKSTGLKTPIGESVIMVGVYHNKGDHDNRDVEIAKLGLLVQHLQRIEKYDKNLLKEFKNKIYEVRNNWELYFGLRMEINVAASLIMKNVKFVKTEAPDFTILDKRIYIECGSIHVIKTESLNMIDKIRSAIVNKSNKPYCSPATALFLDTTNIDFSYLSKGMLMAEDEIKRSVKCVLESAKSKFGSLLLFSYFMTVNKVFHSGYLRVDNSTINKALLEFLDVHYPISRFWTGPGWTPRQG